MPGPTSHVCQKCTKPVKERPNPKAEPVEFQGYKTETAGWLCAECWLKWHREFVGAKVQS